MTEELPDIPFVKVDLRLPWHWRIYFFLRLVLVRTLRGSVRLSVRLNWPWACFHLMQLQRKLGLRFHQ